MRREVGSLAAALCLLAAGAVGEELAPPLTVSIGFAGLDGAPAETVGPGENFRISLTYRRADGQDLPEGLAPHGWLRPIDSNSGTCADAARQKALSGKGSLPGVIDLSRTLIGVAAEDGSLTVVDPELNLASANIVAAARLGAPPAALEADRSRHRFVAALTDAGRIVAVNADDGGLTELAGGLDRPGNVFVDPQGGIWIEETGAGRLMRLDVDGVTPVLSGLTAGVRADGMRKSVAAVTSDTVTVIETAHGVFESWPLPDAVTAVPLGHHGQAAAALTRDNVLHVLDNAHRVMDLPDTATWLEAGPHGRWLAAFAPGTTAPVVLIDLERGAARQAIPVSSGVTEVAFAHDMLFVMTADQAMIRAVDLGAGQGGSPLPVRRLSFGRPSPEPVGAGLVAGFDGGHGIIAVHRESFTGFRIHAPAAKTDMPPMDPVGLRGGTPVRVAGLAQGFSSDGPGRFTVMARIAGPGRYQLVVESGVAGPPACIELPTLPMDTLVAGARLLRDARGLHLVDARDRPIANAAVEIYLSGLRTHDRTYLSLRTSDDGRLPELGAQIARPFAISVRTEGFPGVATLVEE